MTGERASLDDRVVEIAPAPSDDERRAILVALERVLAAEGDRTPGSWWEAGLAGAEDEP